jgi:hypothetical protein
LDADRPSGSPGTLGCHIGNECVLLSADQAFPGLAEDGDI